MDVMFGDERVGVRLWGKASQCPVSGCWMWIGRTHKGYGREMLREGRIHSPVILQTSGW